MRVLVTGSSGWLGRFLAPRLRAAGHESIGLDIAAGPETQIIGSVADATLVASIFEQRRIDAVIHAAALHKPDIIRRSRQSFVDVNVTGTLVLLENASKSGCGRFVFTSTTSLMVSEEIREEKGDAAIFMDEAFGPLAPRNIYGATKLAAEALCRAHHVDTGINCVILRTGRFFPEEDDTYRDLSGPNRKANEFLNRRLTVADAADAHIAAVSRAPSIGFDIFIVSALTPFSRDEAAELKRDAPAVVSRHFPDAAELYARRGWRLPSSIGRVYDARRAARLLPFRCRTDFAAVLDALRSGGDLPFAHDPDYVSPAAILP